MNNMTAADGGAAPWEVQFVSGKVLPEDLPFSEGVRIGNLVLLAGQIGVRPGTLSLVTGGLEAETRQTFENVRSVLEGFGCSLSDVVRCNVFLADIAEWPTFNEVYRLYFPNVPQPARTAVACTLALGAHVEIECMAVVRG